MAIAWHATGTQAHNTAGVSVPLPTLSVNDIAILVASTIAGGTITITTTGGWTWNSLGSIDVASGEKLYAWWGVYSGSETAPTVTPGSDHVIARIASYSGCSTGAALIHKSGTSSEATSDTSFSYATGLTTTEANCLCLCICTTGADLAVAQFTTMANTSLAALAERMDDCTTDGGGGGFAMCEGLRATAGTMGTWTSTLSTARPKAYMTIAFLPALVVVAAGIPTAEAFGSPAVKASVGSAGGIGSLEAVGQPAVKAAVASAGIPTAEAFGQPTLSTTIAGAGGIATAAAIGQPSVAAGVSATGVPSAEAVGQPAVKAMVSGAGGIPSAAAIGQPIVDTNAHITGAGGIPSAEAFGLPTLAWVANQWTIFPIEALLPREEKKPERELVAAWVRGAGGIPSAEAIGMPTLTWGRNSRGIKDERDILAILEAVA
jgi:hypothetical protein